MGSSNVIPSSVGATVGGLNTPHPSTITDDSAYAVLHRAGGHKICNKVTLDGNGAQNDNIFEITGWVEVFRIFATCEEATDSTTLGTCYWDMYDGTVATEITDNGGTNLAGIGVDCGICRDAIATSPLTFVNNSAASFDDGGGAGYYTTFACFRVMKKTGVSTYIRFNFTGDANTDVDMKFCVIYFPLSDDSSISAV